MPFRLRPAVSGSARRSVVLALVGVLVVATAGGWWFLSRVPVDPTDETGSDEPLDVAYTPPSSEGYVGSEACAQCHADLAASFKSHPMSRSITRVDLTADDATVPRTETRITGRRRVYDVEIRDGAMIHHEKMFDAGGDLIYDQGHAVDYVVGSGRRAKAYLHQEGDLLFMSPLNWYSQTRSWDMAPSYTPEDPRRFSRRVTDDCLACHAGRIAPVERSLNKYQEPAFHEMAIGCENCHGPGAQHIALHESGGLSDAVAGGSADPIVNPARLDPDRRESVCYQCHLIAEVRLRRFSRSDLDFRPSQRLSEIWTVLDAGSDVTADGRTRSVNHVQQMRDSRCFSESDGALGCISCHDPHRLPSESERVAFYRERCFRCHDDASCELPRPQRLERDNSCIACHMPSRDSNNISHVTQTDHRIVRTPETTTADGAPRRRKSDLTFFNEMDDHLPAWERDRAEALTAWMQTRQSGQAVPSAAAHTLREIVEAVPDDGVALNVLGSIASGNGLPDRAIAYHRRAREFPATEEVALSALLDLYYARRQYENVVECADRLIEIDPFDTKALSLRADSLALSGRTETGIVSAEKALEINPTLMPVREWLARAYGVVGRLEDQHQQEDLLRRMNNARPPRDVP